MKITGIDVITPWCDPADFQLDWVHQVAVALSQSKGKPRIPTAIKGGRDEIRKLATAMRKNSHGNRVAKASYQHLLAWHQDSEIAYIIQALLLTELDNKAIAEYAGNIDSADIQKYHDWFFRVRAPDGTVRSPHLLKLRFEKEIAELDGRAPRHLIWKAAALNGGSTLLNQMWGISTSDAGPGLKRNNLDAMTDGLIEMELARRVLSGGMSTSDLVRIKKSRIEHDRFKLDSKAANQDDNELLQLLLGILQLTRPAKPKVEIDEEDAKAQTEALQSRFEAEKRIRETKIQDNGVPPPHPAVPINSVG